MEIIKNFLKYTIKFALIGLAISGIMSLGLIGSHGTCKNTSRSCHYCSNDWGHSCEDCFEGCFGSIFGALGGCLDGCVECEGTGCIGGFFHGLWHGCDNEFNGLRGCVESCKECGEGYKECGQGVANDCGTAAEEFKKDEKDKKRAKNFLIYITSICAAIGAVFGLSIGIQATRREILAKEYERQKQEQEEKARKEAEKLKELNKKRQEQERKKQEREKNEKENDEYQKEKEKRDESFSELGIDD